MLKEEENKDLLDTNSDKILSKVIIYKGELEYMSRCILDYPKIETGGNLFGFYTPLGIPVIQYVLGPGKKAEGSRCHFKQDMAFFNTNADMLIKEHALHHIGTWHSHHELGINHPSGGDVNSMIEGMKESGVENFLLFIGNYYNNGTTVNAYSFNAEQEDYLSCEWVVLDEESPIRCQFDKKHRNIIHLPHKRVAKMQKIQSVPLCENTAVKPISFSDGYWLNDKANKAELKKIVDYLKKRCGDISLYRQEEDQTLLITVQNDNHYEIVFPDTFPEVPPTIRCNNQICGDFGWDKKGAISEMFTKYIKKGKLL